MEKKRNASTQLRQAASLLFALACPLFAMASEPLISTEQYGLLLRWLPDHAESLQLVYKHGPANAEDDPPSSRKLHQAIDRIGATMVVLKVKGPYDQEARLVGGYNPYRWRSWTGAYERSPGKFIFDLGKEQRWFRQDPRQGRTRKSPDDYGLSFGVSDLVVSSDLATGSARNTTFADDPNRSVLLGQSGPFLVEAMEVYEVIQRRDPLDAVAPLRASPSPPDARDPGSRSPAIVPDPSLAWVELIALLLLVGAARFVARQP